MFSGPPHQSGVLRPSAYLPRVDCPSPSMLRLAERILRPAKLKVNNQGCMYPQKSSQRRRLAVSQSRLRQIAGQNSVNADFKTRKVGHRPWLLADARCPAGYPCRCPTFCRKPDSGAPHHPTKSGEEINLELAVQPDERIQNRPLSARTPRSIGTNMYWQFHRICDE